MNKHKRGFFYTHYKIESIDSGEDKGVWRYWYSQGNIVAIERLK